MKNMKKLLAIILAVASVASTFTACGSKSNADVSGGTVVEEQLEGSLISKDKKTFSIFLNFNNMPFDSEWEIWQEIGKRTNIYLEGIIPKTSSDEKQSFTNMINSGELADIIGFVDAAALEELGRDGGLIPLNDLIDKYAPNIKRTFEENDKVRRYATSLDGNIYQIPKAIKTKVTEYWWIRGDWLEKLNLEVPTTVDELYDVLTAFRNNDPNGNGIKDEIPLFDRAGYKMPDEYLYLWDTSTEFYVRDGKVEFEPLEPNFKTGVTNIAKWYREGLIDPEILTRGSKSRDVLLGGDIGGLTHDWQSAASYNKTLANDIPGFKMIGMAPPADQNGKIKERTESSPVVGWGISSTCKDPVTVIKFMDYFFSEEGANLVNWGVEGDTYIVDENGNKVFTDKVVNSGKSALAYLRSMGCQYRIGMDHDPAFEMASAIEDARETIKMYNDHPEWYAEDMPPYVDGALTLKYMPEDEKEYNKIMGNIRPYVDECFQKWLLGISDFEADYPGFVESLKKRGIDRAIEINQKAYDIFVGRN